MKQHSRLFQFVAIALGVALLSTIALAASVTYSSVTAGQPLIYNVPQTIKFNIQGLNGLVTDTNVFDPEFTPTPFSLTNIGLCFPPTVEADPDNSSEFDYIAQIRPFSTASWSVGLGNGKILDSKCYLKGTNNVQMPIGHAIGPYNLPSDSSSTSENPSCATYIALDHRFNEKSTGLDLDNFSIYCDNLTVIEIRMINNNYDAIKYNTYHDQTFWDQWYTPQFIMGSLSDTTPAEPKPQQQQQPRMSTQQDGGRIALAPQVAIVRGVEFYRHNLSDEESPSFPLYIDMEPRLAQISGKMPSKPTQIPFTVNPVLFDFEEATSPTAPYTVDQYSIEIQAEAIGTYSLMMASQVPFTRTAPSGKFTMGGQDNAVIPIMNKANNEMVGYVSVAQDLQYVWDCSGGPGQFKIQQQGAQQGRGKMSAQAIDPNLDNWWASLPSVTWYVYKIHIIKPKTVGVLYFQLAAPLLSPVGFLTSDIHAYDFSGDCYYPQEGDWDDNFRLSVTTNKKSHTYFVDPRFTLPPKMVPPRFVVQDGEDDEYAVYDLSYYQPLHNKIHPMEYSYRVIPGTHLSSLYTPSSSTAYPVDHYQLTLSNYHDILSAFAIRFDGLLDVQGYENTYKPILTIEPYTESIVCNTYDPNPTADSAVDPRDCQTVHEAIYLTQSTRDLADLDRILLQTSGDNDTFYQFNPRAYYVTETSIRHSDKEAYCPFIMPSTTISSGEQLKFTYVSIYENPEKDLSVSSTPSPSIVASPCVFHLYVPQSVEGKTVKFRVKLELGLYQDSTEEFRVQQEQGKVNKKTKGQMKTTQMPIIDDDDNWSAIVDQLQINVNSPQTFYPAHIRDHYWNYASRRDITNDDSLYLSPFSDACNYSERWQQIEEYNSFDETAVARQASRLFEFPRGQAASTFEPGLTNQHGLTFQCMLQEQQYNMIVQQEGDEQQRVQEKKKRLEESSDVEKTLAKMVNSASLAHAKTLANQELTQKIDTQQFGSYFEPPGGAIFAIFDINFQDVTVPRPPIDAINEDKLYEFHLSYLSTTQPIHPINKVTHEYWCELEYSAYTEDDGPVFPSAPYSPLIPNPFTRPNGEANYESPPPMGPYVASDAHRYRYSSIPTQEDIDSGKRGVMYHAKATFSIPESATPHQVRCLLPRARDVLNSKCYTLAIPQDETSEAPEWTKRVCEPLHPIYGQFKIVDYLVPAPSMVIQDDNSTAMNPQQTYPTGQIRLGPFINNPIKNRIYPKLEIIETLPPIGHFKVQESKTVAMKAAQIPSLKSLLPTPSDLPEATFNRGTINLIFNGQVILTPGVEQYLNTAFHTSLGVAVEKYLKALVFDEADYLTLVDGLDIATDIKPYLVKLHDIPYSSTRLGNYYEGMDDKSVYLEAAHLTLLSFTAVDSWSIQQAYDATYTHTTTLLHTILDGAFGDLSSRSDVSGFVSHQFFIQELVIAMNQFFKENNSVYPQFSNGKVSLQLNIQPIHSITGSDYSWLPSLLPDSIPIEAFETLRSVFTWGFSSKVSPACFTRNKGTCGVKAASQGANDVICPIECPLFTANQLVGLLADEKTNKALIDSISCSSSVDCSRDITALAYNLPVAQCIDNYCQTTDFARFEQNIPIRGGVTTAPPIICPANQLIGSDGYTCNIPPTLTGFRSQTPFPLNPGANNRATPRPGDAVSFAWDYTGRSTNLVSIYVKLGSQRHQIVPVVEVGQGIAHGTWPTLPQQPAASTAPAKLPTDGSAYAVPQSTTQPLIVIDYLELNNLEVAPVRINNGDTLAPESIFSVAACQELAADGTYKDICKNGGSCNTNTGLCSCVDHFSGSLCDDSSCAAKFSCNAEGTKSCAANDDKTQQCICNPNWAGSLCEYYQPCSTKETQAKLQCRNGGTIQPLPTSTPDNIQCNLNECACLGFWGGRQCQSCQLQCFNGGEVIGCDQCQCPQDSFGARCQCKGKQGTLKYNVAPKFILDSYAALEPKSLDAVQFHEWSISFMAGLKHDLQLVDTDVIQIKGFAANPDNSMTVTFHVYYACEEASPTSSVRLTELFTTFKQGANTYFSAVRNSIASTTAKIAVPVIGNFDDLKCSVDPATNFCRLEQEIPFVKPYTAEENNAMMVSSLGLLITVIAMVLF